ncbi:hypothetical protein HYH03_013322 [Edaphochlamys debaryana]|uniref:Uncharacterized protein n=1 Tax=Edaphochlamys debaryana TaxID=47281 RepID=A0A835XTW5_9CHLO|nr:hypothetical protein HYH03_013322 [Edaphochlamys debaryana]|eukprot:KAG2488181.1 hypothetical protein HYH03_013322 [Edaphochlamys debaryana]
MRATAITRTASGGPSASFRNRAPGLARSAVAPATLLSYKQSRNNVAHWARDGKLGSGRESRQQPQPASDRPADYAAAQAVARAQLDALLAREAEVVLLRQQLDEQRRLWAEQQALVGDRLDRIASRQEALAQQLGAQLTASMQHTASLEEQMGRAAERQEAAAQELGLGLTGAVWEQHEQAAADRAREMEQLRRELTAAVAEAVAEAVAGQRREGREALQLQLQLAGAVEEEAAAAGRHQRGVAEELGRMAEQVDRQRDLIAGLLAGLPPKREGEAAASTAQAEVQEGVSRLHLASLEGDTQTVKALLDSGACADATSWPGGDTPLHLVAREGHVGVAEALLSAGASTESVDEAGCTPLMTAAHHGQLDIVKALLAAGADKNAASKVGWGAVHMAWMEGHSEVSRLLLKD